MTGADQRAGGEGRAADEEPQPDAEAAELIAQIRQLAGPDPVAVRKVVADVLAALDRVTGGTLREQLPDDDRYGGEVRRDQSSAADPYDAGFGTQSARVTDPDPHLADPHLADPHLADPHLAEPHPAGPRLADPYPADPHPAQPRLTESGPTPGPNLTEPRPAPDPHPVEPRPAPDPHPVKPNPAPDPHPARPNPAPDPHPAEPRPVTPQPIERPLTRRNADDPE